MNRPTWTSAAALAAILGMGLFALNAVAAPETDDPAPPTAPAPPAEPKLDPKTIWPAGLKALAGRYQFVQVSSPGGLWARSGSDVRQVSLNELTPAARERLRKAELVIAEIEPEGGPDAREEISPSKRGKLRFYSETALGRLTMHNLPGIGGESEDKGEFSGPVEFGLNHTSHSNPSVSGILFQRMQQEATWGAATLDFADLEAVALVNGKPAPRRRLPAPPRSTTQRLNSPGVVLASVVTAPEELGASQLIAEQPAPKKPAPAKPAPTQPAPPAPDGEEEEPPAVITNARVLRSGIEIIAFVQWTERVKGQSTSDKGSVRLIKMDEYRRLQERLGMPARSGGPSPAPLPAPPSK